MENIKSIKNLTEKQLNDVSFSNKGFLKRSMEYQNTIKINIFYAMMITALARLKLHKEIMKSKIPYYCDSDSIVSISFIVFFLNCRFNHIIIIPRNISKPNANLQNTINFL